VFAPSAIRRVGMNAIEGLHLRLMPKKSICMIPANLFKNVNSCNILLGGAPSGTLYIYSFFNAKKLNANLRPIPSHL
jgi:hypothetical protein